MRPATMVLCLLLAGGIVWGGFCWKANTQNEQEAPISDQATQPIDDGEDLDNENATEAKPPAAVTSSRPARPSPAERSSAARPGPDQQLLDALASSDEKTRGVALRELGRTEGADPKLLTDPLTNDPSPNIRQAAARGLAQLQNRDALPDLMDALDDEDVNVRVWAITALHNTIVGIRFPYNASDPREERLMQIENIRRHVKRIEAYRALHSQP